MTGGGSATVGVDAELTIAYAAETVTRLTAALDTAPESLRFDLRAVTELDTAGLQVLIWVAREAAGRGVRLTVEPSDEAGRVLASVGLDATRLGSVDVR